MAEAQKDEFTEQELIDYMEASLREADTARRTRIEQNKNNFDNYHLRHDFSHKKKGQSREVLSKQAMAVEQTSSFFQQALVDLSDWWSVELKSSAKSEALLKLRPHEIKALTDHMLEKTNYYNHVGNAVKSGLLGSLMITKTTGCMKPSPKYRTKKEGKGKNLKKKLVLVEDETWQLEQYIVRQENYYPDPTGAGLYEIEVMWADLWEVLERAEGDESIYDKEAVEKLSTALRDDFEEQEGRTRETGQDVHTNGKRPRVKLTEFWGTVVSPKTGKKLYENVVFTVANDRFLIRKPTPNPLWHQKSPYSAVPLIEVPNSVWHRALMDAPTQHNKALIEIYNLILDSAMKAVYGITQVRTDALDDVSQIVDGIEYGTALQVNSSLPPGAKAIEQVVTGEVPNDALNIMNVIQQEFNSSALTNDLRQGVLPSRSVKATEVVEASQTITSVFSSLAKNVEQKKIKRDLELAWQTIAQNLDLIDEEELIGIFGEERGREIAALSPEDVFADTINYCRFQVYGITQTLSKAQDFRKLTTLLQTVGSSEVLLEEFVRKYDFGKLLGEIMTALDIDKHKIELPLRAQAPAAAAQEEGGPAAGTGEGPDQMSQAAQPQRDSLAALFQSGLGAGGPQAGGQSGGNPVL